MSRATRAALALAVSIAPLVTYATEVHGKVTTNEKEEQPVHPAKVRVLTICDDKDGRELVSSTNRDDGTFAVKFETDGNAVCLKVDSAGYQGQYLPLKLKGQGDVDLKIKMNPSAVWVDLMFKKAVELQAERDPKRQQEMLSVYLASLWMKDAGITSKSGVVFLFLHANPELVDLTRKCEDKVCKESIFAYDAAMQGFDGRHVTANGSERYYWLKKQ